MKTYFIIALSLWNLLVFVVYVVDKYKAVHGLWRISEKTLILMSLCAGGLGAFLAGKLAHHKTRKWYFWLVWMIGLAIDLALVIGIQKL